MMALAIIIMAYMWATEDNDFMAILGETPQRAQSSSAGAAIVALVGCMDPVSPSFDELAQVPCSGTHGCYPDIDYGQFSDAYQSQLDTKGCCNLQESDCTLLEANRCPTLASQGSLYDGQESTPVMTPCNNGCCLAPALTCADINGDGTADDSFDCGAHTHSLSLSPASVQCAPLAAGGCSSVRCCTVAPPVRTTATECTEGVLAGMVRLSRTMDTYAAKDNCWVWIDLPDDNYVPARQANGIMDADEPRAQLADDGSYTIDLLTCDALEALRARGGTDSIRVSSTAQGIAPCDPLTDPTCTDNIECDGGSTARSDDANQQPNAVVSKLTRVAGEVQKVLVGPYSPRYAQDSQRTNKIARPGNAQAAPQDSQCSAINHCDVNTCPLGVPEYYSPNGAGFDYGCLRTLTIDTMVQAFGLPDGTDIYSEDWQQPNCGEKCEELQKAEIMLRYLIEVAVELSTCTDVTAVNNPSRSYPYATSKRELAQNFIYGRMASVIVLHSGYGLPIDLNDDSILEEMFLFRTPRNLLQSQIGGVLTDPEFDTMIQEDEDYNCPPYMTCGAAGSCNTPLFQAAMKDLAALNRAVHAARVDSAAELEALDVSMEELLAKIRGDVVACQANVCSNNAVCVEGLGDSTMFTCLCTTGFTGLTCADVSTGINSLDGYIDYSGAENLANTCEVYNSYDATGPNTEYRVWDIGHTALTRTVSGTAPKRTVGAENGFWRYSAALAGPTNPESNIVSWAPTLAGAAACPLMVTRADASSANRLTTLTEFLQLELAGTFNAAGTAFTHADAMDVVSRAFNIADLNYYDHDAIYGGTVTCDQKRNTLRAFLKLDLLIEAAKTLSASVEQTTEATAYYEVADLASGGRIDLTGGDALHTIQEILIYTGVDYTIAEVAAEYLVQQMRTIESSEVCDPVKFALAVAARAEGMTSLIAYKAAQVAGTTACDGNPCQSGGSCTNVIRDDGGVGQQIARCDCLTTANAQGLIFSGSTCTVLSVSLAVAGQAYVIEGVAFDNVPYEGCTVYVDLNGNGALDAATEGGLQATTSHRAGSLGSYSIRVDPSITLAGDTVVRMITSGTTSGGGVNGAVVQNFCPPLTTRADACAMTSATTIQGRIDEYGSAEGRDQDDNQIALNDLLNFDGGTDVYGVWELDRANTEHELRSEYTCTIQSSFCTANCDSLCDEMLRVSLGFSMIYKIAAEVSRPEPLQTTMDALMSEMAARANARALSFDDAGQVFDLLVSISGDEGCRPQPTNPAQACSAERLEVLARYIAGNVRQANSASLRTETECISQRANLDVAVEIFQRDSDACVTRGSACTGNGGICVDVIASGSAGRTEYNCECPPGRQNGPTGNCETTLATQCSIPAQMTNCIVTGAPVTGTIFGMSCDDPAATGASAITCDAATSYEGCSVFIDIDGNGYQNGDDPVGTVGANNVYTLAVPSTVVAQFDSLVYLSSQGATNARPSCDQVLHTRVASNQMNSVTTLTDVGLVVKPEDAEFFIAGAFTFDETYGVFTAPIGNCGTDTTHTGNDWAESRESFECMKVEVAVRQLDVLIASASAIRSTAWRTRSATEDQLYSSIFATIESGGPWISTPDSLARIISATGAAQDTALAVATGLAEWNLQLYSLRPQGEVVYMSWTQTPGSGFGPNVAGDYGPSLTQVEAINAIVFNAYDCMTGSAGNEVSVCQNGASCIDRYTANTAGLNYDCICTPGFTGAQCQTETVSAEANFYGYAFGPFGPYQGCQVYIDINGNTRLDAGEPTATTSFQAASRGVFAFTSLPTTITPLMRVIMVPVAAAAGSLTTVMGDPGAGNGECPYLETIVPDAAVAAASGSVLGRSSSDPMAMSDLTTLQLIGRTSRVPAGNPVTAAGVGEPLWQNEMLNKFGINLSVKPFETRCNWINPSQGAVFHVTSCSDANGDAVFETILGLHTMYRVGDASTGPPNEPESKLIMVQTLASVRPCSRLAIRSSSCFWHSSADTCDVTTGHAGVGQRRWEHPHNSVGVGNRHV